MKLNLPEYINCSSPEVAFTIAHSIAHHLGYSIESNIDYIKRCDDMSYFRDKTISLVAHKGSKCVARYSETEMGPEPIVTSLSHFYDIYSKRPLKIGDYEVERKETGVQIGCTFVDWETVEKVLALRDQK